MTPLRTLFLQAPAYNGFDGGAGSRYQARREVRSFWYPTWLAQPAALVPGSRLLDASADGLTTEETVRIAQDYDLVILHTSAPSFAGDLRFVERLRERRPDAVIGMVGAQVAVDPQRALERGPALDFVCREEFDFTCREIADGRPLPEIAGLSHRRPDGTIAHNADRPPLENMDELPFVAPVYRRDLTIGNYVIGYLKHPFVSLYTGRGCRSRCTFCLWPQTVGGHRYRVRSVRHVLAEVEWIRDNMPEVREIMFDDDTFTDLRPRAEEIARGMGRIGVTWSCNAKANVPYDTLKIMKDNGLRLLLVGYESGDDRILRNVRKGVRTQRARRFTEDCRELGILVHGTFVLGLPGETRESIDTTIRYAVETDPHTVQVSLAAPYPGTELHRQAVDQGWLAGDRLVDGEGVQLAVLEYPGLSRAEISDGLERFYRAFYFRPSKMWEMTREMLRSPHMMRRRLGEGIDFLRFLRTRNS